MISNDMSQKEEGPSRDYLLLVNNVILMMLCFVEKVLEIIEKDVDRFRNGANYFA